MSDVSVLGVGCWLYFFCLFSCCSSFLVFCVFTVSLVKDKQYISDRLRACACLSLASELVCYVGLLVDR